MKWYCVSDNGHNGDDCPDVHGVSVSRMDDGAVAPQDSDDYDNGGNDNSEDGGDGVMM